MHVSLWGVGGSLKDSNYHLVSLELLVVRSLRLTQARVETQKENFSASWCSGDELDSLSVLVEGRSVEVYSRLTGISIKLLNSSEKSFISRQATSKKSKKFQLSSPRHALYATKQIFRRKFNFSRYGGNFEHVSMLGRRKERKFQWFSGCLPSASSLDTQKGLAPHTHSSEYLVCRGI